MHEIKELSVVERIQLAQDVWETVHEEFANSEISVQSKILIDQRLSDHATNPDQIRNWDEIKRRLLTKL
jgi:putative addiction module component (TIGR02574 family)